MICDGVSWGFLVNKKTLDILENGKPTPMGVPFLKMPFEFLHSPMHSLKQSKEVFA